MSERLALMALLLTLILAGSVEHLLARIAADEKGAENQLISVTNARGSATTIQAVSTKPAPFGKYIENINGVALELVKAPTGDFMMGNDRSPNPEEKPRHKVTIRSFYVGQYEVTRQQWNVVAMTLPRVTRTLRLQYLGPVQAGAGIYGEATPADELSWEEAVEFCDRLTNYTGKRYRLLSEAEWEYACRAGTQTEYSFGDDFNPALANMVFVSDYLLPIGWLGYSNAWGLYDMHGNASEWCLDHEHANYIGAPTDGSAWIQGGNEDRRSRRGGGYRLRAEVGRSSARTFFLKNLIATGFGFRVAAEITPTIGSGHITSTSAASYVDTVLAPESIAALFGSTLSSQIQLAAAVPLPTTIAGASLFLKDSQGREHLAPLFFASPTQINFQVPPGLPAGPATIFAVNNGNIHSTGAIEIASVAPGLFAADALGKGLPAALVLRVRANGEQVYEPVGRFDAATNRFVAVPVDISNPTEQVFLILFGTGFRNRASLSAVAATVGGANAPVEYAGAQGGLVGVDQANLRLPASVAGRGEVDVVLNVEGKASNAVRVVIR